MRHLRNAEKTAAVIELFVFIIASILPHLQPNYISAQLGAWRYGTRTATAPDCMQIVAGHLSEDDVTALAAWLSSLPPQPNAKPLPRGSLTTPLVCGSEPK